jgi:hypothetical protein
MKKKVLIFLMALTANVLVCVGAPRIGISDIYFSQERDAWGIDISLENPDTMVSSLQFDLAIPTEFSFVDNGYYFTNRAQVLVDGKYIDTHSCWQFVQDNGTMTSLVSSFSDYNIKGNSGKLMFIKLSTDNSTSTANTYKANLINQEVIAVDDEAEDGILPVFPQAVINDKTLRCYDVMGDKCSIFGEVSEVEMAALNEYYFMTGERITGLDVSECTNESLGEVDMLNLSAVILARTETQVANEENVFWDESGNMKCNRLALYDASKAVSVPYTATANEFRFDRVLKAGQWNTVSLPVTMTAKQFEDLTADGTVVATIGTFDRASATLTLQEVSEFQANTPYAVKPATNKNIEFNSTASVVSTDYSHSTTIDVLTMQSSTEYTTLCSTDETSLYGYDENGGVFRKVGKNVILKPFRCYLSVPTSAALMKSYIDISPELLPYQATALDSLRNNAIDVDTSIMYDALGRKIDSSYMGIRIKDGLKHSVKISK